MQFTGAKGITLFVAIVLLACGVGFGSGLLLGRRFPSRNFQKFGESRFVLDSTTGKVCDPFKDPKESSNIFDHAFDHTDTVPKNPVDQSLSDIWKTPYPPACGK